MSPVGEVVRVGDLKPHLAPGHIGDELMGALTADALKPKAFDEIEQRFLAAVGALAALLNNIANGVRELFTIDSVDNNLSNSNNADSLLTTLEKARKAL